MNIVDKILVDPITRGLKFFTKGGVPAYVSQVRGRTDGSSPAAGDVGEIVTTGQIGSGVTVSNSWIAIGNLTLQAGVWAMYATADYVGSPGNSYLNVNLNTAEASASGTTAGVDNFFSTVVNGSGAGGACTIPKLVRLSSPTTYHLNAQTQAGSAGIGGVLGCIQAVRIA